MNGLISYIDISDVSITEPTVVGQTAVKTTNMSAVDFKAIIGSANMFVVKFKVGAKVYEATAIHEVDSSVNFLRIYINKGLNHYTYTLAPGTTKVTLSGDIYKAAAPA